MSNKKNISNKKIWVHPLHFRRSYIPTLLKPLETAFKKKKGTSLLYFINRYFLESFIPFTEICVYICMYTLRIFILYFSNILFIIGNCLGAELWYFSCSFLQWIELIVLIFLLNNWWPNINTYWGTQGVKIIKIIQ